jgi:hypothetical protein
MIISINAEKAFRKIQHPFMIKALNKLGIDRRHPNIIKTTYDKNIANIILNRKTKTISFKARDRTKMSIVPTLIHYSA